MRVGLVGYGGFGRALGSLLDAAGLDWRALDPWADVPEAHRAASLPELVSHAEVVVLAVPVPSLRSALEDLRPHVRPSQLVLDVASVKVEPVRAMREVLGARVPWVGTHPMFGPRSVASGAPLRVVVCPHDPPPDAARRARQFYERLGCEVLEQTPEAHDRVMAHTQALTFFMARGMMDAGTGVDIPFAPSSFQALARIIDGVRTEPPHLFATVERENPFAREARQLLLDALASIHQELEAPSAAAPESEPPPLPGLEAGAELTRVREDIDAVDRELVGLLARRVELARRAARAKAQVGQPVPDPAREEALVASRGAWAAALGLDEDGVEAVFRAILRFSRRSQHSK
jgi:prephenate dehydrogenase